MSAGERPYAAKTQRPCVLTSGVRRKFSRGGFIKWHAVAISISCALFATSQLYVIFMFPNQRFGEVC